MGSIRTAPGPPAASASAPGRSTRCAACASERPCAEGRLALIIQLCMVEPAMRLPDSAHRAHPWRIHELAHDFRLEDVWALPTPGGPDDFPRLVRQFASGERSQGGSSGAARTLWAIRWKVG